MKLKVDQIKEKPLLFSLEEPVDEYPILTAAKDAGECRFTSPLHLQITVTREHGHIRAGGRVATGVALTCSRCLTEFETDITSCFTIFYFQAKGMPQDKEVELSEEDLISATYSGDEIDLSPEIAEQVMMEIPIKPLCRENCPGLCNKCGADLNTDDCGCERTDINFKLGALKNFKVNK